MNAFGLAILFIPLALFFIFIPYLTRKTESFGVSIPEEIYATSEMKQLRKKYALLTVVVSIVVFGIVLVSPESITEDKRGGLFLTFLIFGYMIIEFFIYLYFHRIMKQRKKAATWWDDKTEKVMIHTNFRKQQLRFSNTWFIIPFLIFLITTTLTYVWYDKFPDQLPTNFDFLGEAKNFVSKSYLSAFALPLTQLFLIALFFAVNILIGKVKQQISSENPDRSLQQNVIFRRRWSLYMIASSILLTIWLFVAQFISLLPKGNHVFTVASIIIHGILLVGVIYLAFSTGQGGSRVKIADERNDKIMDRDNDRYWKLGVFYVNRQDPSIFLEKRFGIGWTFNWGNPKSWGILFAFSLLIIGIILLTR